MKKIILPLILLAIFSAFHLTEASVRCTICGKEIKDRFVKYNDGSVYCMECAERYDHCSICGKPSVATTIADSKVICRDCLTSLDRCSFCGKALAGKYLNFPDLNLKLCEKCAVSVPRCNLCGRPDKDLISAGEMNICKSCYAKSDFCYICGSPIVGEYTWFNADSTKLYCQRCVNSYPKCSSCGAPSGRNSVKLDDGRLLCRDCYNSGYFEPASVSEVKNQVLEFMNKSLGMNVRHKVRYTLQGIDFIRETSEGISGDLNGLFYRKGDDFEIYVLYGLRRRDLCQVIAHETAHAWAAENCRSNLTLTEAEGFAQWVAYHCLEYFGHGEYGETLTKGDNEYAAGLRMMLGLEKKGGKEAVFKRLAK
jgi:hypothetical protein